MTTCIALVLRLQARPIVDAATLVADFAVPGGPSVTFIRASREKLTFRSATGRSGLGTPRALTQTASALQELQTTGSSPFTAPVPRRRFYDPRDLFRAATSCRDHRPARACCGIDQAARGFDWTFASLQEDPRARRQEARSLAATTEGRPAPTVVEASPASARDLIPSFLRGVQRVESLFGDRRPAPRVQAYALAEQVLSIRPRHHVAAFVARSSATKVDLAPVRAGGLGRCPLLVVTSPWIVCRTPPPLIHPDAYLSYYQQLYLLQHHCLRRSATRDRYARRLSTPP